LLKLSATEAPKEQLLNPPKPEVESVALPDAFNIKTTLLGPVMVGPTEQGVGTKSSNFRSSMLTPNLGEVEVEPAAMPSNRTRMLSPM
jgi:hypothetical protein